VLDLTKLGLKKSNLIARFKRKNRSIIDQVSWNLGKIVHKIRIYFFDGVTLQIKMAVGRLNHVLSEIEKL
jgi:hypothetical protein